MKVQGQWESVHTTLNPFRQKQAGQLQEKWPMNAEIFYFLDKISHLMLSKAF